MIQKERWPGQTERQDALSFEKLKSVLFYDGETGQFLFIVGPLRLRKKEAGYVESNGYRRIKVGRYRYKAHRLAWFYAHGRWPEATIDHKNGNPRDNRITNLREASESDNLGNSKCSPSLSGLKGAVWDKCHNYWQSYIQRHKKKYFLGHFSTAEAAHAAYCKAAERLFGEFARGE